MPTETPAVPETRIAETDEPRFTLIGYDHAYGDGESSNFTLEQSLTRAVAIERAAKLDHSGYEVTIVEGVVRYAENFMELHPDETLAREIRAASRKIDAEERAKKDAFVDAQERAEYERLHAKFAAARSSQGGTE
jgi:hypothetical protein